MGKGIVLALYENGDGLYSKLVNFQIKNIKKYTKLPIFLYSNVEQNFDVDYLTVDNVEAIENYRKIRTENGIIKKSFQNHIKFLASINSPFEKSIQIDLDYVINTNNLEKLIDYKTPCFIKNVKWLGKNKINEDLIFSWVYSYSNYDKELFEESLKLLTEYTYTDRVLYILSKKYNFYFWDDVFYSYDFRIKNQNIIKENDVHVPYKESILQT